MPCVCVFPGGGAGEGTAMVLGGGDSDGDGDGDDDDDDDDHRRPSPDRRLTFPRHRVIALVVDDSTAPRLQLVRVRVRSGRSRDSDSDRLLPSARSLTTACFPSCGRAARASFAWRGVNWPRDIALCLCSDNG